MFENRNGKTTVVFLILVVVVLISGISISLFLLNKETQTRKAVEVSLSESQAKNVKLDATLKETEKQVEVLKGKMKDADDKIDSLMVEIDMQKALRDEAKAENKKLKDSLEAETKAKVELRDKLSAELSALQTKLTDTEAKLKGAEDVAAGQQELVNTLKKQMEALQQKNGELETKIKEVQEAAKVARQDAERSARREIVPAPGQPGDEKVELEKIVVTPENTKEGRVLNVDTDTDFLIFDIGSKNGITQGMVMSVYRGKTYLGDVKVSRVQEEMSAADFIPPFSSRKVRKNDQVVPKR